MGQVHHFTYGWITPVFAYAMSFLGSLLGLVSTARARSATDKRRRAWLLVLAAWAIGGTGIWVMHFMAMIGFSVTNAPLRYDVPITVASFIIAVVCVGIGLFIVGYGKPAVYKVLIGGPITGVSVAFMHYTGMAAMNINGHFGYQRNLVIASYAIAIVAATVALWFTVVVRGPVAIFGAAVVMGLAVCSMHYTGMAAMQVQMSSTFADVPGVDVNWFLAPIVLFVIMVVVALVSAVMAVPSERETAENERLREQMSALPKPATAPSLGGFGGIQNTNPGSRAARLSAGQTFASRAANGIADARRPPGGR